MENHALRTDVAHSSLVLLLESIQNDVQNLVPQSTLSKSIQKVKVLFNEFEQLPKLLDGNLRWYIETITSTYMQVKLNKLFILKYGDLCESLPELIYVLAKVRGYKFVTNFFESNVYIIPQLLDILQANNAGDFETYMILLWLSSLVMVPFPLSTIHANIEHEISTLAINYMSAQTNASKCQLMSLVLLADLVTRPDCFGLLREYINTTSQEWVTMENCSKLGHLLALNQILKRHSSLEVCEVAEAIHTNLIVHDITQLKFNPTYQVNSLHVVYLVKVSSKVARIAISKGSYDTVAIIINNYIHDIMNTLGERLDAKLRETIAKNLSRIVGYLNLLAVNYSIQLIRFVTEQLEVPIGSLYGSLGITLESFDTFRYHTIILFLGFLALTKAVSDDCTAMILSVFHSTCKISNRTSPLVQGSLIRDASCFCAWAVLKSLSPEDFTSLGTKNSDMWDHVFGDLLAITIFDEDFTIRRCGIAVLQEFIGRFGSQYFRLKFPDKDDNDIGELTLKFIELFGSSTVGSLADSHTLILQLSDLGFPPVIFMAPLYDEITNREIPFEFRKLGSQYLSGIQSRTTLELFVAKSFSTCDIVANIISIYQSDSAALYTLAEFYSRGYLNENDIQLISHNVGMTIFDHHHDTAAKAESMLHWYNMRMQNHGSIDSNLEQNVLSISRSTPTEGLVKELMKMFTLFSEKSVLPISISDVLHHIFRGNILLARTSTAYILANNKFEEILDIVSDKSVDADVRSDLILTLCRHLPDIPSDSFSTILNFLDDYTVTNQGDVGLKIRFACLSLLESNIELSRTLSLDLVHILVRLAAEPMDKIRVSAFQLLCNLKYEYRFQAHYNTYLSDYQMYFSDLSQFYITHMDNALRQSFWKGMVHTAGALTGSNLLINESFRLALMLVYREHLEVVVGDLLKLLRIPPGKKIKDLSQRTRKTYNVTLNFVGKLFDCGLEMGLDFAFEALFVRTYNLHINNSDVTRIRLVLKIFQFIATWVTAPREFQIRSIKRICWLACSHVNEKVRISSAEALFEIANEKCPEHDIIQVLDSTDWSMKQSEIYLTLLEKAYTTM